MTWPSSVGLKRHGMTRHFPFGSPPAPLCPICSICAQRREGTQHRRLALELFFNHHREKRKHLSSCAHEGKVLSQSSLACCTASAMANRLTFSTCLIFTATHALKLAALARWNALTWERFHSAQRTLIASRFRIAGRALTVSCTASGRFRIVDLGFICLLHSIEVNRVFGKPCDAVFKSEALESRVVYGLF